MNQTIQLEPSTQTFSSYSGLLLLEKQWSCLKFDKKFKFLLPRKKRNKGPRQLDKLKSLLYSFAIGGDCLSDIDSFNKDPLFRELTGSVASRTMGDFLNSFGVRHVQKIQELLIKLTFDLRQKLFTEEKKFILSMDSTPHEHYSQLMEGMAWNYKNMWCLDSQNAYDQFGLSYVFDLRPGNTHSAKESQRWIHEVFKHCPSHLEKWFRADSAYGKNAVYEALEAKGVKFAIVLRENLGRYVRGKNRHNLKWEKTNQFFFNSHNCEIAMGLYPVSNYRVVFIRKRKSDRELIKQMELLSTYDPQEDDYKYYSLITNVDESEMSNEEVIDFYKQRATAETYIKEQKWKSVRNKKTKKIERVKQLGYFSKKARSTCLNLAGQVIRSARKMKLRVSTQTKEVLDKIMNNLERKLILQE